MPDAGPRRSGSSSPSAGSRSSSRAGPRRGGGGGITEEPKRKRNWLGPIPLLNTGDIGDVAMAFASPWGFALEKSGLRGAEQVGRALQVTASSPYYSTRYPRSTAREAKSVVTGLWEAPYGAYKLHQQGMSAKDIGSLFATGLIEDYKRRYGKNWREEAEKSPLSNLFDALTVLGAGARGAALAGASARLSKAGLSRSAKNLWRESSRPGVISTGEAFGRTLRYQPDDPDLPEITSTQPFSRSPLRRGLQQTADVVAQSERFRNAPLFGSRSRITRAGASQLRRAIDRSLGGLSGSAALDALSDAERSRLFWGSQLGDHSPEALRSLRKALSDEYDGDIPEADADFKDWLRSAKQQGFGGKLLERLDKAILAADKTPIPKGRYLRAAEFMQEATNLSEQVIKDSNGFTSLANDIKRASDRLEGLGPDHAESPALEREIADLTKQLNDKEHDLNQMFAGRRGRVRDWLNTRAVADNDARTGRIAEWTENLGEEEARVLTQAFDRVANTMYRDDPNRFWDERVGAATGETIEEFLAREASAYYQPGVRRTVEGMVEEGIEAGDVYYSPLQKWATEQMPRRMPKDDFENVLLKGIGKQEIHNAALDMYLEEIPEGDFVYREDFLNHLANPMNQYNLEEVVLVRGNGKYETRFDKKLGGALLSRAARDGEYREIYMRLPGEGRTGVNYAGKGQRHWLEDNVVGHVRYHVFEEDGKRKLLIEELQSDWESEFRDASAVGDDWKMPTDDDIRLVQTMRERLERIANEIGDLQEERERVADLGRRSPVAEKQGHWDAFDQIDSDVRERTEAYYDLEAEIEQLGSSGLPPSPLGPKYYRALVRRIAREAAEEEVDEIIMVDPSTQALRNVEQHDLLTTGKELTSEIRDAFDDQDLGVWHRLYGKDFPNFLAKEYGLEGSYQRGAYRGYYSTQGQVSTEIGDVPGRVFAFTDDAKAKAMKPSPLYQRQPDWKGLPKGATEYLEGGRTRIHAFKTADVSTWIHELSHVAFHDLPDADKDILSAALAGGRHFDDWLETDHESYARAFERYFRDGVAPIPELRSAFKKLADWIGQIWEHEKQNVPDLDPGVKRVFDSMLASHQPDVFIPHRAGAPNLTGARTSKAIPRAQRDIGSEVQSRIPLFRRNNLALMRSGLLNDDPRTLVEHVNRVIMLARANQLREAVLEMSRPLLPDELPDFETQYVVKKAGRGVDRPTYDALEASDDPTLIRETVKTWVDDNITDSSSKYEEWKGEQQLYVVDKGVVDQLFKYATGKTPGATTKPQTTATKVLDATLDSIRGLLLYANPGFYVANIAGNALMTGMVSPKGYKDLAWSMNQARKAAHHEYSGDDLWHRISVEMGRGPTSGGLSAKPTVLGRKEDGMLSALRDRPPGTAGKVAEGISHGLGSWGRRSGRIIDDSWRVAAWKSVARKNGYETDAEIKQLLDDASRSTRDLTKASSKAKRDLNAIRDEAEQLMLDFDSMTPFERTYLTRAIFLYPFLKASAKYPAMYATERPIVTGLGGQAALQSQLFANEALGERPDLPAWLDMAARGPGGMWNVGSVAPFAASLGLLESALGVGQEPEIGVNTPWGYANPFYQLLLELGTGRNRFGQEKPAQEILRQDFPAPGYLRYFWKEPSNIYAEKDYWNTLLRAARGPFEVNADEARKQAEEQR